MTPEVDLPFRLLSQGIHTVVRAAGFGAQDRGVSPGGAMDRFSHRCGNLLLGNEDEAPALEMILAPQLELKAKMVMVVTGGHHEKMERFRGTHGHPLKHGQVFRGEPGDRLVFGRRTLGFRSYLAWKKVEEHEGQGLEERSRGPVADLRCWGANGGGVRLLPGPEFERLQDENSFFQGYWVTSPELSSMGMRLEHRGPQVKLNSSEMVSAPVADGTVQMTPKGPIVLLRHRQTVGGYPRIFNVISADLDRLGQYGPGQVIPFELTDLPTARQALREAEDYLATWRTSSP